MAYVFFPFMTYLTSVLPVILPVHIFGSLCAAFSPHVFKRYLTTFTFSICHACIFQYS